MDDVARAVCALDARRRTLRQRGGAGSADRIASFVAAGSGTRKNRGRGHVERQGGSARCDDSDPARINWNWNGRELWSWVSIPLSKTRPPSELASGMSNAATTGLPFGSNRNVTCAIQAVAIEPPRLSASKRPDTASIAPASGSVALVFHRSRIIQASWRAARRL